MRAFMPQSQDLFSQVSDLVDQVAPPVQVKDTVPPEGAEAIAALTAAAEQSVGPTVMVVPLGGACVVAPAAGDAAEALPAASTAETA